MTSGLKHKEQVKWRDHTLFLIDASPRMLAPHPSDSDGRSCLQIALSSVLTLLGRKLTRGTDKLGILLYGTVRLFAFQFGSLFLSVNLLHLVILCLHLVILWKRSFDEAWETLDHCLCTSMANLSGKTQRETRRLGDMAERPGVYALLDMQVPDVQDMNRLEKLVKSGVFHRTGFLLSIFSSGLSLSGFCRAFIYLPFVVLSHLSNAH
jgi:hypothetical protein